MKALTPTNHPELLPALLGRAFGAAQAEEPNFRWRLSIGPQEQGQFRLPPFGRLAGRNLLDAADFAGRTGLASAAAVDLLNHLGGLLAELPEPGAVDRLARGHQPLHSAIGDNWEWASLVPLDEEEESLSLHAAVTPLRAILHGWRAALFIRFLQADRSLGQAWEFPNSFCRSYQMAIGRLCRPAERQLSAVEKLGHYLSASMLDGLLPKIDPSRLDLSVAEWDALRPSLVGLYRGLGGVKSAFRRHWADRRRIQPIATGGDNSGFDGMSGFVESGIPVDLTDATLELDDIHETTFAGGSDFFGDDSAEEAPENGGETAQTPAPIATTATARRTTAVENQRAARDEAVLPGSVRVLDAKEAQLIHDALQEVLISAVNGIAVWESPIVCLVGATGRPYELIVEALRGSPEDGFSIDLQNGTWRTCISGNVAFTSSIAGDELKKYLHPTERWIDIPLPSWVWKALRVLSPGEIETIREKPSDAILQLLKRIVPRFTVARMRAFVAAHLVFSTLDSVLAQALTGGETWFRE